jgi:GntR family transcriptional regulator
MTPSDGALAGRLDRGSSVPLWAQLIDDCERRLQAGEFADQFPGEFELCREYDVSRHTVREALRRLRERGVLDSGRGRTTKVRQDRIEQSLGALYSLFREVEARGMLQRSAVLACEQVTDLTAARRLGLDDDEPLLHLARVRFADEEPLAVDRAWLPLEVAAPLLDVDFSHAGLYDELQARADVQLTGGRETITAVVPSPDDEMLLALPAGVGVLRIERTAWVEDRLVEWRSTLLRGDRFAVFCEWSRRSGYRLDVRHGSDRADAPAG